MPVSEKQLQILAFPFTDFDALICDGAIRSGKTSFMTIGFIEDAMRRFNNQRFGICGKTVESAGKNIIQPFLSVRLMHERYQIQWHKTDKILSVAGNGRRNIFEVFGGKDESSFQLIQGRTLAGVLMDEVALQPKSFVEQALARCSVDGSRYWFNCNPESPAHWFYTDWVTKPEAHNALHIHFSLDDNPALSERIKDRYRRTYSGVFYDRYILGRWVTAEGAIYKLFTDHQDKFVIDDYPGQIRNAVIGVDFGGGTSAHAFCCTGFTMDRKIIVLDEYREKKALDPIRLADDFCAFVKRCQDRWIVADCWCDSAEQTLINGLRKAADLKRIPINIGNAQKREINDRIRATLLLMGSGRFFVNRACTHTIDALKTAVWDSKRQTEDVRLDNGTTNIDSLDAMEYSFEREIPTLIDTWGL